MGQSVKREEKLGKIVANNVQSEKNKSLAQNKS